MEEFKELSVDSFKNICRLCLAQNELEPVTKQLDNNIILSNLILTYTSIQVNENEQFPTKVCGICSDILYAAHKFIEKCKSNQQIIISIVEQAKQSQNVCTPEIETPEDYTSDNYIKSENENDSCNETVKTEDSDKEDTQNTCIRKLRNRPSTLRMYNKSKLRPKRVKSYIRTVDGPPFVCSVCSESYDDYAALKKHRLELKHLRPLKHTCPHCGKGFSHKSRLEEHIRTHTGEKPNACPTCDRRFNSKVDLKRHMHTHSTVKRYKCKYCDKGYNRKFGLRDHERTHTGERLYCTCCGKEFTSYCTLYQHERKKKYNLSIYQKYQKGQFPCKLCNKVLTTEQSLRQHTLLHGPKNYNCEKCGRTYVTQKRLNDHVRNCHKAEDQLCTLCDKGFKSRKALVAHYMRSHGDDDGEKKSSAKREHPCPVCGRICVTKQTLEQHVLQHGPKNVTCEVCGKAYASEKRLKIHIAYAHNDKEYTCPICGKVYKSKDGYDYHMKNHTGENVHVCDVCSKEFKCKGSLRDHMRLHTGEAKFKCSHCNRVCLNKRKLMDHLRVHTGEKPYSCSVCGKAFAIVTNLNTHMRIHTGEKTHLCPKCGKGFYDSRNLRKHLLTHNNSTEEIKIIIE